MKTSPLLAETTEPEMALTFFFEEHYLSSRPRTLSLRTVELYEYSIQKFSNYLGHEATLGDLLNSVVGEYIRHLGESRKPGGVDKERRQLSALWRSAYALGMIRQEPTIQQVKVPVRTYGVCVEHQGHPMKPLPNNAILKFLNDVYIAQKLIGKSEKTARLYRCSVKQYKRFLGREPTLDDLTNETMAAFLQWRLDEGTKKSTTEKDRVQISAIWRFAVLKREVEELPIIPPIDVPTVAPVAWTMEELGQLLDACSRATGAYVDNDQAQWAVLRSVWWTALHRVLWCTGERIGAVMALKWKDVDGKTLNFPPEVRKRGLRYNYRELDDLAVESLGQMRAAWFSCDSDNLVFPWSLTPTLVWPHYRQILATAGLPHDRLSKFHRIRKSVASHIHAKGGNAQEAMQHANRRTTESYLDPRICRPEQPIDSLPQIPVVEKS